MKNIVVFVLAVLAPRRWSRIFVFIPAMVVLGVTGRGFYIDFLIGLAISMFYSILTYLFDMLMMSAYQRRIVVACALKITLLTAEIILQICALMLMRDEILLIKILIIVGAVCFIIFRLIFAFNIAQKFFALMWGGDKISRIYYLQFRFHKLSSEYSTNSHEYLFGTKHSKRIFAEMDKIKSKMDKLS